MPKLRENVLNTTANRQKQADKMLVSKIKEKCCFYGIDSLEISVAMRTSLKTFYRRIARPENMTLGELKRLGTKLKFTNEDYITIMGREV